MAVYWLTFRLEQNSTYQTRYEALVDAVDKLCSKWWVEPSSFFLFESSSDVDDVATKVKVAINPSKDVVLIGMTDYKSARLVGAAQYEQNLRDLMPSIKKA